MQSDVSISLEHVSKLFVRREQRTMKELLPALLGRKKTKESFWALQDVNLTIKKGETIGIVGENGSGKSTLLKLIAGVSQPTKGRVQVNGKIAPLIELGAGFHPELTGRENVYLNGVILGLKRKRIDELFEDIVGFSEIQEFIDTPIKHYSSGMYLRLAFSVAVHTDPGILLMDEILAVGDNKFQKKCLAKMEQFKKQGVTIVIVSHSSKVLRSFAPRCILLHQGQVKALGPTEEVLSLYAQGT